MFGYSSAALFGLSTELTRYDRIQAIEKKFWFDIDLVSIIFTYRSPHEEQLLDSLSWSNKIFHFSLSPTGLSALQIAEWMFDETYRSFFEAVKRNNLKVIFRTMHEMNWGRYYRSLDPVNFKKAWKRMWHIAQDVGLDKNNILFVFSFNHFDMFTYEKTPSQNAELIECKPALKIRLKCLTFEDYYPWNKYVDMMGVTFYNRWKGNSDRRWLTPRSILYHPDRNLMERMRAFNKPLIIDEVATTAVWYPWPYNFDTSRHVYLTNKNLKNNRLSQLHSLLETESDIVAAIYFNKDYTQGLKHWIVGELDWMAIDVERDILYPPILRLLRNSQSDKDQINRLFDPKFVYQSPRQIRLAHQRAAEQQRQQLHSAPMTSSETVRQLLPRTIKHQTIAPTTQLKPLAPQRGINKLP